MADDRDFMAVLKIAPDSGKIHAHGDVVRPQVLRGTHPRQHQQLRSIERTARENHLATRTHLTTHTRLRTAVGMPRKHRGMLRAVSSSSSGVDIAD